MIRDGFFATPNLSRYTLFTLFFQMGMAVSLAAMPIYFKNENALSAYGMAYSAMAITGAFSFVWGVFVDRIGFVRAIIFGVALYGIALSMRVFTHPVMAVMTAIMAGVGASVAILANRSWVLQLSESGTQNTTELTAIRSMIVNVGLLVGTGLVSVAVYAFGSVYFWLLLLAGVLVFVAMGFACQNYRAFQAQKTQVARDSLSFGHSFTLPICLFALANLVAGVYTGLFKPYLILMFVEYGVSESKSVFIYLLTTAMSIVAGMGLLKFHRCAKSIPFLGFFGAMIGLVLAFVMMSVGLNFELGLWVLVLAVLARSLFLSLSGSFEQVLEYELLDRATLAMALGLTQTAFLAGDALGSLMTSFWIVPTNSDDYARLCLYCAVLVLMHVGVIFGLRVAKVSSLR